MPELPEVESVKRELERILGRAPVIEKVLLKRKDLRRPMPTNLEGLVGSKLRKFRRRGKFLLFDTDRHTLINHLGMTGWWRLSPSNNHENLKHDHVEMVLSGGKHLIFNDARRFGLIDLVSLGDEKSKTYMESLGPEPLDLNAFTGDYLFHKTRERKVPIKTFIMDQKIVVGVGNIYASEALFRAGIHPLLPAHRLKNSGAEQIVRAVREVLTMAIEHGGSTIRDFKHSGGEAGGFQERLHVYDRQGKACVQCDGVIFHQVVGGRSTYFCKHCQRKTHR